MVDDDVADKLFYHHPRLCCPHGRGSNESAGWKRQSLISSEPFFLLLPLVYVTPFETTVQQKS